MSVDSYIGNRPVNEATGTRREWTATSGQDTFPIAYVPGYVDVFLNGVKLAETDFTATDGTSVVLASGASDNDVVAAIAWAKGAIGGIDEYADDAAAAAAGVPVGGLYHTAGAAKVRVT